MKCNVIYLNCIAEKTSFVNVTMPLLVRTSMKSCAQLEKTEISRLENIL